MSKKVGTPTGFEPYIARVLLLERLREVNALLGFTRVEAPDEGDGDRTSAPRADRALRSRLGSSQRRSMARASSFSSTRSALVEWEALPAVKSLEARLRGGHRGWRIDATSRPGRRLSRHSLRHASHARASAHSRAGAGVRIQRREHSRAHLRRRPTEASLRRASSSTRPPPTRTERSGASSILASRRTLVRLLQAALDRAKICASDPLCAEHDPTKDQSLHGAACHACSFVAETSCERGNRYLDRALVVPTLEVADAAFFEEV